MALEKNLTFKPENISCERFPEHCNKAMCEKMPCNEIRGELLNFLCEKRAEDPYSLSSIDEWLQQDTWNVRDAFLIMADLSPDGADINWVGFVNCGGVSVDLVEVRNAQLFSEHEWFYIYPTDEELNIDLILKNEIIEKIAKLKKCEEALNKIKRVWEGTNQPKKTEVFSESLHRLG